MQKELCRAPFALMQALIGVYFGKMKANLPIFAWIVPLMG